jgi:glycosyltransferase involved in cell wall biosynthesis
MIGVSVILTNYNHAPFLKERIDSVLNQTHENFELIILDDCSEDNSRDIIEPYKEHPKVSHVEYNKRNSGFLFRQWQKGVQLAKEEWIWIAQSDDVADPLFLETLVACIQQYPSSGIVYSNSYKEDQDDTNFKTTAEETNFDFSTTNWDHSHFMKGETAITGYLSKKNIVLNASCALMKKQYLTGIFPEIKSMKYYADWYIYIHIAAKADFGYCHQLLNTFRRHPGSIIRQSEIMGIKTDCFRILNLLSQQVYITNKPELVNYFTDNYLKPGLKSEGTIFFIRLMTRCFFINPGLAMIVIKKIVQSKRKRNQAS